MSANSEIISIVVILKDKKSRENMVAGSGWSGDLLEGNARWNEAFVGKLKGLHSRQRE